MQSRKPKFKGKETKWEIKRKKRPAKRVARGKKPLAEPITIASLSERKVVLKKGKMVFYNGNKRIEIPLERSFQMLGKPENGSLQGIYKRQDGSLVTFRSFSKPENFKADFIGFFKLVENHESLITSSIFGEPTFAYRDPDLGHVQVSDQMRGESLGLKAVSKTDRDQRAKTGRSHRFYRLPMFERPFERIHYRVIDKNLIEKRGKINPKDNLDKFHRIEAIDPKTGKARIFTFPIKR